MAELLYQGHGSYRIVSNEGVVIYVDPYAGEVQIAKADMENTGLTNVIGHVREEELFLLDDLRPWQKFRFVEK